MVEPHSHFAGSTPLNPLVAEAEIRGLVRRLADDIARGHPAGVPLVVVGAMKGALLFMADLVRCLPMPIEIETLRACSYDGTERGEGVRILDDVDALELTGRHVLLVDTVLDSGHTLAALRDALTARGPASLRICVLLRKRREPAVPVRADYVGREIPDVFVVGYGLDHADGWRHLAYVAELPPEAASP